MRSAPMLKFRLYKTFTFAIVRVPKKRYGEMLFVKRLSFKELEITQETKNPVIKFKESGAVIASLTKVNTTSIGVASF